MDRSQLNLSRGLLFACAVDDGSKNLIGAQAEDLGFLNEFESQLFFHIINVDKHTIVSQINPIVWRVAIFKLVFCWLLTKPRRISIKSGHWPWGSSTAAIAATTCEAKFPAF
jgi:hypothetical protein